MARVEWAINSFRAIPKVYQPGTHLGEDDSNYLDVESLPDMIRKVYSHGVLNRMVVGEDIVSKVNRQLLIGWGEFPNLDAVARCLCLGPRTMRRQLQELGTSYQQILDDVRRELAVEYLRTSSLKVQEIADLLGYSVVTNFSPAFMRWVEVSPYQYRKQFVSV